MDFDEFAESMDGVPDPALQRITIDNLEARARSVGLYMEKARMMPHPSLDPDTPPTKMFVFAEFSIGKVAWRPRTQDPEVKQFDDSFRELAMDAEDADFIAKRDAWREANPGWDKGL